LLFGALRAFSDSRKEEVKYCKEPIEDIFETCEFICMEFEDKID